jgi:4-amino-4-deoxy-L-arabinose transferase-like glycosyltransferase
MPSRTWKVALVLAALSTVLKLCLLVFPSVHVSPGWVLAEEMHRGNIAKEILRGPLLPILDYSWAPNVGGSVVAGVLAVPFVAVFGETIAAVRAVPILFNALCVALVVLLLDRFASRRAAWIGGALVAIAPPGYSLLAITAFGTHVEGNALTLACVFLFLELHRLGARGLEGSAREARTALAFGLCAGFALYFCYSVAVALLALLAYEFAHDKLFLARRWARFALLGFAIGFAPWVAYNAACDFRGLSIYETPIGERVSWANLAAGGFDRLVLLLGDLLPNSFYFKALGPGRATGAIVALAFLSCVVALAWSCRARLAQCARATFSLRRRPNDLGIEVLFLLYVLVFVIGFAATDMGLSSISNGIAHDGRYAAPLYPFLAMIAACALDRAWNRAPPRVARFVHAVPFALAALSCIGTLGACDFSRAGECFRQPGTSDELLARWMAATWRTDVDRLDRVVERIERTRTPEFADGMIFMIAQGLKWGIACPQRGDPNVREKTRRNIAALGFLHDRVADAYKPYCEHPRGAVQFYAYRQRERFWIQYRHRERAKPCRELLALRTPAQ